MLASLPVSLYKYPLRGEALFEGGGGGGLLKFQSNVGALL